MKKNAASLACAQRPASGHSSCGGGLAGFYQPGALVQCATFTPIRGGSDLVETETAINKLNKSVQKFFCFDCFLQKQEVSFNSASYLPVPTFKPHWIKQVLTTPLHQHFSIPNCIRDALLPRCEKGSFYNQEHRQPKFINVDFWEHPESHMIYQTHLVSKEVLQARKAIFILSCIKVLDF